MGLVAPWHVGSFQIRDRTRVSCVGRQILYHWATREAPQQPLTHPQSWRVCPPPLTELTAQLSPTKSPACKWRSSQRSPSSAAPGESVLPSCLVWGAALRTINPQALRPPKPKSQGMFVLFVHFPKISLKTSGSREVAWSVGKLRLVWGEDRWVLSIL